MAPVNLEDLQGDCARWRDHNFPGWTSDQQFKGMVEELGEIAHWDLKAEQGIRKGADPDLVYAKKKDSVGDLIIYLTGYCTRNNINLEAAVRDAWIEVQHRDWIEFPKNGVTE